MAARNMLDESYNVDDEPEEAAPEAAEATRAEPEVAAEPAAAGTKTPIGRRGTLAREAREAMLAQLADIKQTVTSQGETYRQELERISRENAELRGHVQGIASRPAQAERQPEAEDPSKLLDEANRLLDAKDFNGYQRKYAEYNKALVFNDPRYKQAQQPVQQQPGMNPMLQMVASQYVDVVSDRAALEIAKAHDRILEAQGVPESPDRWKRAFEEGRRYQGQKTGQKAPGFDQKSRGALAGVPTSRNGAAPPAGSGEPGVTLSALERSYAKAAKMTDAQYAKHLAILHPERVER